MHSGTCRQAALSAGRAGMWCSAVSTVAVLTSSAPSLPQIYPFCDAVMQTLLTNLQSPDVHRNIKPQVGGSALRGRAWHG